MLNKYILKTGTKELNLKINLGSNESFLGYQQEINNYIDIESVGLINDTNDTEMRKYKYNSGYPYADGITLSFIFNDLQFTNNEITGNSLNVLNSFYTMEVYDDFNEHQNTKLSTNYFTNNFNITNLYIIDQFNKKQFYYLYIPEYYISQQTGTTFTIYTRFLFYNAKSGKTSVFYNQYVSPNTDQYTYFQILIDNVNKTWKFTQAVGTININQISEINSSFIQKINNNVTNLEKKRQFYPSGQTFNYETQKYITLSGLTNNY